jgi:hypothetical protein
MSFSLVGSLRGGIPAAKKRPRQRRGLEGIPEPVGYERTRGDNRWKSNIPNE